MMAFLGELTEDAEEGESGKADADATPEAPSPST
jgi:hypothetical protein